MDVVNVPGRNVDFSEWTVYYGPVADPLKYSCISLNFTTKYQPNSTVQQLVCELQVGTGQNNSFTIRVRGVGGPTGGDVFRYVRHKSTLFPHGDA